MSNFGNNQQNTESRFEFVEEASVRNNSFNKNSAIIDLTINNSGGLIKNKTQATYFLTALTVLCIILTIFFISRVLAGPTTSEVGEPQTPTTESAGEFNEPPGI